MVLTGKLYSLYGDYCRKNGIVLGIGEHQYPVSVDDSNEDIETKIFKLEERMMVDL
jgi:hypothetical protein